MSSRSSCLHSSLHHPNQREWSSPHLHSSQLIYPLFVTDRLKDTKIEGFDPNVQWGNENEYATLVNHLQNLIGKGLKSVMLFGVVQTKDAIGSNADDVNGPVCHCLRVLKRTCPSLMLLCDVCLCEYTDHGHCGLLKKTVDMEEIIDNEKTLDRLANVALAYATSGAHVVCPSDMMDNRISRIRTKLTTNQFSHVSIMAYSSKKASCMYAPFRNAVESTFQGDRKRYQQPVGSISHALRAYERDLQEGADSIIVKPCLFYTDIVREYASFRKLPVVAYVVSGEYKMLMDYGKSTNSLEEVVKEAHLSVLRAGANVLITYFTPYLLEHLGQW